MAHYAMTPGNGFKLIKARIFHPCIWFSATKMQGGIAELCRFFFFFCWKAELYRLCILTKCSMFCFCFCLLKREIVKESLHSLKILLSSFQFPSINWWSIWLLVVQWIKLLLRWYKWWNEIINSIESITIRSHLLRLYKKRR